MPRLTPDEARMLGERLIWGPEEAVPEEVGPEGLGAGVFGRYHLVRLIGQGGMGSVYEAEQESPKRRVAIKVIRPELMSAEVARRFEHEARILGRLQHPGIAQIYEAGRVEGGGGGTTPYFAMEFVEGVPLTEFAKVGGLGVRARLELFLRACEAVEHAHRMGVIHRDLKPGNILVDAEGRARILDFGVARATDADVRAATMHTEMGRLLGTLPYMSPEQVAGDADGLDTRSDVYSLGVVLYELLAERPPYEVKRGPVHEAARVITETEPAPLSTVSRVYRGDLETIVGKALAKERERRYQSVGELAADIRRYLSDEPIVARRAGKWYQWRKFAARHRGVVVAAGIAAVLLASTAGVSTAWAIGSARAAVVAEGLKQKAQEQEQRAEAKRLEAEASATVARAVSDFYNDILRAASPQVSHGDELTVREVLDAGAERISSALADQVAVRVEVESTIGASYAALGLLEAAESHAGRAYEVAVAALPEDDRTRLRAASDLGYVYLEDSRWQDAAALLRSALPTARRALGDDDEITIAMMQSLACAAEANGEYAEALSLAREVTERASRSPDPDQREAAVLGRITTGRVLSQTGEVEEAEAMLRKAMEEAQRILPEGSPVRFSAMTILAAHYNSYRRSDEAVGILTELVAEQSRVLGADHPNTLVSRGLLADALGRVKRYDEAEAMFRELIPIRERVQGKTATGTLTTRHNLAGLLRSRGKHEEAAAEYRAVLAIRRETLGPEHPDTLTCAFNLALALKDLGRLDEAVPLSIEAADGRTKVLGERHPLTVRAQYTCGRLLMTVGRTGEAESRLRGAADASESVAGLAPTDPAEFRRQYGCCLMASGHFQEAAVEIERAYDAESKRVGNDAKTTQSILRDLVKAHAGAGQTERAEAEAKLLLEDPSKP